MLSTAAVVHLRAADPLLQLHCGPTPSVTFGTRDIQGSPPAAFAAVCKSTTLAGSRDDESAATSSPFELSLRIPPVGGRTIAAPGARGHRRGMHP